ncbi:MAG: RlmE family RNA methyltransferase [Myxococcaceae bacterium]|jgi:23S rRNA (uridine2552-2'-O)-methyltransferase|nr:RlmE family RNA methyltransferase [Myxococcaceae bacterium]
MANRPYQPKDRFFKQAKAEGLRARSAFKIDEIARRFRIFQKGQTVLDLGAAPGGFLQILLEEVGPKGRVVGVDLAAIRPLNRPNVKTAVADVLDPGFDALLTSLHDGPFDVVVSDLAPKTTGIKATDEARSLALAGKALEVSVTRGRPGGHFVAKLFMGRDFEAFRTDVRKAYGDVKVVRPEATRGGSMEIYLVGLSRRPVTP